MEKAPVNFSRENMQTIQERKINNRGFTLVELMVTVFLTAIAVISIYRGYTSFSQAADAQQQVMEMQQNLRIGMSRLIADIRRAGINEEDESGAGFISADSSAVEFSMDITGVEDDGVDQNGDGEKDEPGERDTADNDGDGVIDEDDELIIGDGDVDDDGEKIKYSLVASGSTNNLIRETWKKARPTATPPVVAHFDSQTVITNVEALNFVYFDDASPVANILATPLSAANLPKVAKVEITLVVRTTNEDFRYTNTTEYKNLRGTTIYDANAAVGDDRHVRRRSFSITVQIRNNF